MSSSTQMDPRIEAHLLRRQIRSLQGHYKRLESQFANLRTQANALNDRVEAFLYRSNPTSCRAEEKKERWSAWRLWWRALLCLPLPEELDEESDSGEEWLIGTQATRVVPATSFASTADDPL